MDRFSNKTPINEPSAKALFPAQPLKLKESLRIRDGLGVAGSGLIPRPILEILRTNISGWSSPWMCDN